MRKALRIITISILCAVFLVIGGDCARFGYTGDGVAPHFYYMFFHASPFHLAANCIAAWLACRDSRQIGLSYAIAVIASFVAIGSRPTVGFSGVVYSCIGVIHSRSYKSKLSKPHLVTLLSIIPGFFLPNINALLHLICYLAGIAIPLLSFKAKSFAHDYGRIIGRP